MSSRSPAAPIALARELVPGLLVTALVAMAAAFLGSHYRGSMLLFALLLGLDLHFISEDARCAAGIRFASGPVLRAGLAHLSQMFAVLAIAGVGLKTSLREITALGWQPVLLIVLAAAALAAMAAVFLSLKGSS